MMMALTAVWPLYVVWHLLILLDQQQSVFPLMVDSHGWMMGPHSGSWILRLEIAPLDWRCLLPMEASRRVLELLMPGLVNGECDGIMVLMTETKVVVLVVYR
jgi:hypothetical protein